MGAPEACPHCGSVQGSPLDALYDEVARIRELAERDRRNQATIEALSREVRSLRETVARLRGTTFTPPLRPTRVA